MKLTLEEIHSFHKDDGEKMGLENEGEHEFVGESEKIYKMEQTSWYNIIIKNGLYVWIKNVYAIRQCGNQCLDEG